VAQKSIKLLLFLSVLLVSGCKLAVINVEGGEVQSTGSGICVAGTVCLIDVADTNFSETFTAVPDDGRYFHKWNQGGRFFCGNWFNPECNLSFEGLQGEEKIEALVASSEVFYLMPVFKSYPRAILVDGQPRVIQVDGKKWEWLQPVDFSWYSDDEITGYSYSDYNEVCPKGVCNGNLPGSTIDLTGYTWASSDEVRLLFQAYEVAGTNMTQDFEYTLVDIGLVSINAIVRDKPGKEGYVTVAHVSPGDPEEHNFEPPSLFAPGGPDDAYPAGGAWFWRPMD